MLEIRIHGRGGQGAVLASQILSYAFFLEGKFSQSFPTFGAERRGAPVSAFVRVSDEFINLRSQVIRPNHVLVLSAKLAETVDVASGVGPDGFILINTDKPPEHYNTIEGACRIVTLNISSIAAGFGLGSRIMPMVNVPILGAYAGISRGVSLEALSEALPRFISANPEGNQKAMKEAFEQAQTIN
ncbi:MAG: 2-oxoacid:acceptor oxidoreductase family protein [Desulfobacterales bacterium]|nr:2-oxoacid:acceptor oxidoreductase family protein [Desulfobacterales bacterium]